jgi:hypothetical protein
MSSLYNSIGVWQTSRKRIKIIREYLTKRGKRVIIRPELQGPCKADREEGMDNTENRSGRGAISRKKNRVIFGCKNELPLAAK